MKNYSKLHNQLWTTSNPSNLTTSLKEIEGIEPYIQLTKNQQEYDIIRRCIHSMEFVIGIGRALRFEVRNKVDDKLLGMIVLASDVPSIECRDEYIGWDKNLMMDKKMLRHTAVMSTCVGVQPFSNNALGCKMIAMMVNEPIVRETWKAKYGDELVGITTTSLHGSFSVYNGIPTWKKMGRTKGRIMIKPDEEIYSWWLKYLKHQFPEKIKSMRGCSGYKQKILSIIYRLNGMGEMDAQQDMVRGVYFNSLYKNTSEFLCKEITSKDLILDERVGKGVKYIMDYWKPKAIKRYTKLANEKRLQKNTLWYGNFMDHEKMFQQWLSVRGIPNYG